MKSKRHVPGIGCLRLLAICVSVVTSGVLQAAPVMHRFLAVDESRKQLHYIDQYDETKSWSLRKATGRSICAQRRWSRNSVLTPSAEPPPCAGFRTGTR